MERGNTRQSGPKNEGKGQGITTGILDGDIGSSSVLIPSQQSRQEIGENERLRVKMLSSWSHVYTYTAAPIALGYFRTP